jgi:hypothetical protein
LFNFAATVYNYVTLLYKNAAKLYRRRAGWRKPRGFRGISSFLAKNLDTFSEILQDG